MSHLSRRAAGVLSTAALAALTMSSLAYGSNGWHKQSTHVAADGTDSLRAVTSNADGEFWAVGSYDPGGSNAPLVIHRSSGQPWKRQTVPAASTSVDQALYGVKAFSPKSVWAVGASDYDYPTDKPKPLVLHYNGKKWVVVKLPKKIANSHAVFLAVGGAKYNDFWIGGEIRSNTNDEPPTSGILVHFHHGTWTKYTNVSPILGIAGYSTSSVRAVGFSPGGGQSSRWIVKWTGTSWVSDSSYAENGDAGSLSGVTATSANDIWAAGSAPSGAPLIVHYNGTSWTDMPAPTKGKGATLEAVKALSPTNIDAVGYWLDTKGILHPLVEHFDGMTWKIVSIPQVNGGSHASKESASLYGVAANNTDGWEAVGIGYPTGHAQGPIAIGCTASC